MEACKDIQRVGCLDHQVSVAVMVDFSDFGGKGAGPRFCIYESNERITGWAESRLISEKNEHPFPPCSNLHDHCKTLNELSCSQNCEGREQHVFLETVLSHVV
ncbi:hypothetical protein TNCV_4128801 [Trichonephila clavipes]|nr:hypothetical protein TNCV_4128801 [Trichonephila clavipes]